MSISDLFATTAPAPALVGSSSTLALLSFTPFTNAFFVSALNGINGVASTIPRVSITFIDPLTATLEYVLKEQNTACAIKRSFLYIREFFGLGGISNAEKRNSKNHDYLLHSHFKSLLSASAGLTEAHERCC
jgi:hypothetical protein